MANQPLDSGDAAALLTSPSPSGSGLGDIDARLCCQASHPLAPPRRFILRFSGSTPFSNSNKSAVCFEVVVLGCVLLCCSAVCSMHHRL